MHKKLSCRKETAGCSVLFYRKVATYKKPQKGA